MSLMPMGSFDWASKSRIAKHLSMAGTLVNAGDIMEPELVSYIKHMFYILNNTVCQGEKNKKKYIEGRGF